MMSVIKKEIRGRICCKEIEGNRVARPNCFHLGSGIHMQRRSLQHGRARSVISQVYGVCISIYSPVYIITI